MNARRHRQSKRRLWFLLGFGVGCGALCVAGMRSARAVSAQWTGASNGNWATSGNWTATPVPGTGNTATFNGAGNGNTIISLGGGVTINSVIFDTADVAAYTIGGAVVGTQTLTLNNNGGVTVTADAGENQLFNANVVLGTAAVAAGYSFTNDSPTSSLTLAGGISGGSFAVAKTLTVTGEGNTALAGVVGGGSGTIALTKTGNGTLTLSGANSFTGALTISGGTVIVPTVNNASSAGPLGNSAAAVALDSGILEYTGGTASSTKPFALANSATFLINDESTTLTLTGLVSGAAGMLIKDGLGTLTLTNTNNSYGGGTTILNGTLKIAGSGRLGSTSGQLDLEAGTLDLNGTSQTVGQLYGAGGTVLNNGGGTSTLTVNTANTDLIYYGTIADNDNSTAGTVALVKSGTGILSLFNVNSYSGPTTVNTGTLAISDGGALGATTAGTTVAGGATLRLAGQDIVTDPEPLTISGAGNSGNGGLGALESIDDGNVFAGPITLGGNATIASNAGLFKITDPGTITGPTFTLTLTGAGDGQIDSIIGTTSGTLTKTGLGTWTLTGANTYSGLTTISAGILNIQDSSGLGATTAGTTVASGATLQIQGNLTIGAEPLTISGTGASGATGALENVSDTNTFGGLLTITAAVTISSDVGNLILSNTGTITNTLGSTITFDGEGDGSLATKVSAGAIIKNGGGTWTFSGANSYNGATTINAGVLIMQNATALGATTGATTVADGATLLIDGNLAIGAEAMTISGPGLAGLAGALDLNANATASYSGLLKLGASAAIGSEAGATLSLTNTGIIFGTSTGFGLTLAGAGNGSLAGIWNGGVSGTPGAGTLTKIGTGKWTLGGTNTFTGVLAVQQGTLAVATFNNASAAGPLGNSAGAIQLGGSGTLATLAYTGGTATSSKPVTFTGTGAGGALQVELAATELTLTGAINGSGSFAKKGAGTLTLAGAGSFSGTADVDEGTLKASAAGVLGSVSSLAVDAGATLQLAGSGNRINDSASLTLQGGTLSTAGLSNQSETMGSFRLLLANSTIDLGSGSGDSLLFSGVGPHTAGVKLAITNWSGTPGVLGTVATDRLIFTGVPTDFTSAYAPADVSFNGTNGYAALPIDASHFEVVAIPEPCAGALLTTATLICLRRPRRRPAGAKI